MKGVLISMVFQIGSALLDACVLSALEEEPLYGYALTQKVKSVVDISESTLYPVLRRLTKDGLLSTYDQPFNGRNRQEMMRIHILLMKQHLRK